MQIQLACPAGCGGNWPVPADGAVWRDPDGREVAVVAGECRRCGSSIVLGPSEEAVAIIRAREVSRREGLRKMRAAFDA